MKHLRTILRSLPCHLAASVALTTAALSGCALEATEAEETFDEIEESALQMAVLRLHFVVTADDGAPLPAADPAKYSAMVTRLNQLFSHVGFQFAFDPATDLEKVNSTLLNRDSMAGTDLPLNAHARTVHATKYPGKLVMFIRKGGNNFSTGRANWVVLAPDQGAETVMHELGHYFHLRHPFAPGEGPTRAAVVERIRAYVEDEGHPVQDGLKALDWFDGDDDYVADTATDLGDTIYKTEGINQCVGDGRLVFQVNFKNPSLGSHSYTFIPTRTNPMAYYFRCPITLKFSEDQRDVIRNSVYHANRMHLLRGGAWLDSFRHELVTPAAVSRHADTVAVFATGDGGRPKSRVWDASRDTYYPGNGWLDLGDGGFEALNTLSRGSDQLHVFGTKAGSGNAAQKHWTDAKSAYAPSNDTWEKYVTADDELFGAIVATPRSPSTHDVFARWVDGSVRARNYGTSGWKTDEWVNLGGKGTSSPAAVRREGQTSVDLFARWSDGTIRQSSWSSPFTGASVGWTNLGGRGVDSPAVVSRRPDVLDLFVRWDDGTIRSKVWTSSRQGWWPGTTDWRDLGGQAASKPVAISRNAESITLATRWVDGSVRIKVWDDVRGSWWPSNETWSSLGGTTQGAPVLVMRGDGHMVVYARWVDGSVRSKVWNASTSQWWPSQTGWISLGTP